MSSVFWRRLPQRLRALHLATSLSAALVLGFYGLSGLVALHQDAAADADPAPRMAPASAMASTATLTAWLTAQLPSGSAPQQPSLVSDEDTVTATMPVDGGWRELQVNRHSGAVLEHQWHPLPVQAPPTRRALAAWFASRLGGDPDLPEDAQDQLAAQDTLCLASVWSVRTITIESIESAGTAETAKAGTVESPPARRWSERRDARPVGAADSICTADATPAGCSGASWTSPRAR